MDRLNTFISRIVRRQSNDTQGGLGGIGGGLPIDIPGLPGRSTTTGTSSTSVTSLTTTSALSTTISSSSTLSSTTSSSTTSVPGNTPTPSTTSATTTATTSVTASETAPLVVVVQTSQTVAGENGNTGAALPITAIETSVVIENKTVTNPIPSTTSVVPEKVGAAAKPNTFLQNKVASGIVFALCGIAGLGLILLIVWFAMRRRLRIKKLEKEIISFDPEDVGKYHQGRGETDAVSVNSMEKGRSTSSLGHYAGNGYSATMNTENGNYGSAAQYNQPQYPIQHPGNAAFNPMAGSDYNRTYALPSQTFNR